MTNLAVKDRAQPAPLAAPAPQSEASALVQMIDRAARDETVDVAKMRELLAMRKEIAAEASQQAFNAAMTQAQTEMRPVSADANNPQTKSRYASYLALDKALRPIYTRHGFALSFNTADGAPEGHVRVTCDVSHRDGHTKLYKIDMPADGKGAKGGDVMTKTHATGSAATYGMRYLLKMIFNIVVGDDDDGNAATGYERVSQDQADKIREALESAGKDKAKFLKWAKIDRIEDLRADFYDSAIAAIKAAKS